MPSPEPAAIRDVPGGGPGDRTPGLAALRIAVNRLTPQQLAGFAAVALAVIGAGLVSGESAGLGGWAVLLGLFTAVPLYAVAGGWRLPWWLHAFGAALPVSILVIAVTDDAGWDGAARAARYGWGVVVFLGVVAWATTPARRAVMAVLVGGLGVVEYAQGLPAWIFLGDPSRLMWGTFTWENAFGAYCCAAAITALAVGVFASRRILWIPAAVADMVASTAVIESGSRTCFAALAAAHLLGLAAALWTRRWREALRWAGIVVAVIGLASLMVSSVVFRVSTGALDSVGGRLEHTTVADPSAVTRLQFWWIAIQIGVHHPLTGGGLGTWWIREACFDPLYLTTTPHSEWALALAEGGLVGLAPVAVAIVAAIVLIVRSFRSGFSAAALSADPARWGALVALAFIVLHTFMDYDLTYPSSDAMTAFVGGIAASAWFAGRHPQGGRRVVRLVSTVLLLGTLLVGVVAWNGDPFPGDPLHQGHDRRPTATQQAAFCATQQR